MESGERILSETLIVVLGKALNQEIIDASFETEQLKGGTVGEVTLVSGVAITIDGKRLPYKVVYKKQKKWERYFDPDSWRREYDLYAANLDPIFSESFSWPKCYYAELLEDETHIWMEYIEGISGLKLNSAMYEQVAEELGRFQGGIYTRMPKELDSLTNLSRKENSKNYYMHYRSWNEVYDYIRAEDCEIPKHLCKMLIDVDENADQIWACIEQLPVVFCHRDFWVENIFYTDQKVLLIDWDTAGWGYLGEDIASLIADEGDVAHMIENYEKSVSAYYRGFSNYVDVSHIKRPYIKEMILFTFGYRLVEGIKFAKTLEEKTLQIAILDKIYEMEEINFHN
ncbi:aminoglycoside phosphotransferase family protein [Clostridium sp. E02]|uniref:phosphotransferase n=1 Tax=Clostridium sp. E02 TaxID=2487134 RepID=UPI000F52A2BF|nr:aminoglycoside phosphotransferase family protein [Clostridium sp. E02]